MSNLIRRIQHQQGNYMYGGGTVIVHYIDKDLYDIINRDIEKQSLLEAIYDKLYPSTSQKQYMQWLNDARGRAKLLIKYPNKLHENIGKVDIQKYQKFVDDTNDIESFLAPIKIKNDRIKKYSKTRWQLIYEATGTKNQKEYEVYRHKRRAIEENARLGGRKNGYLCEKEHLIESKEIMTKINARLRAMGLLSSEQEYKENESEMLP